MMGSQTCGIVGKSQPVLMMIHPIISTRTRSTPPGAHEGWSSAHGPAAAAAAGGAVCLDVQVGGGLRTAANVAQAAGRMQSKGGTKLPSVGRPGSGALWAPRVAWMAGLCGGGGPCPAGWLCQLSVSVAHMADGLVVARQGRGAAGAWARRRGGGRAPAPGDDR
jgi:hypothetical protein